MTATDPGKSLGRVALVWRGDREARRTATPQTSRHRLTFEALAARNIKAEPAVFDEETIEDVREQLRRVDGVLVWVDPLSDGKVRGKLDALLREIAAGGIWVSAHPDTIMKMGVKEVLVRTSGLGWGADTHIYKSVAQFRDEFPARLASSGPRVLKRNRGNGGQGVWKVERAAAGAVTVLHAQRGSRVETLPLAAFLARCEAYLSEPDGAIVDQPFQPRLPEGMIRCYSSGGRVVGYGHQLIKALIPPPPAGPDAPEAQPGPRIMHPASAPQFARLRRLMEEEWIPGMCQTLAIAERDLPAIWDADFLYGPRDAEGNDTYVLCEINVSSVFPIPDDAPAAIAEWVANKLQT